jgi:hypothetical protein
VARSFLPLMLKVGDSLKQVITVARYFQRKPELASYRCSTNLAPVSEPTL